jgi:uncharacterized protein involved in exopolysaccharide biosynthesis
MRPYIEAAFRHRLLVLTPVLVVPLLALLLGAGRARQADSTAVIWVEEPAITAAEDLASTGPALDESTRNELEAQAMRERLATEQFVLGVLDEAGLTDEIEREEWPSGDRAASLVAKLPLGGPLARLVGEPAPEGAAYQDAAISYVQSHLSIAAGGQHLVVVRYTGDDGEIGAALVQGTVVRYQAESIAAAEAQGQAVVNSLDAEVRARGLELVRATEDLATFDAANPQTAGPLTEPLIQTRADFQAKYATSLALYQTAAEELQQARTDAASATGLLQSSVRLVDEPAATGAELRMMTLAQVLVLGVVLGAALAVGAVAVLVWSDRTVRRAEDIERGFDIPVLATLPRAPTAAASAPEGG